MKTLNSSVHENFWSRAINSFVVYTDHGQMSWNTFSKWFKIQLLPNIPYNSLIIMDNAPYHNVFVPTISSSKEELRNWLTSNNYQWSEDMLKAELLEICKSVAYSPVFKTDAIARKYGHRILRNPSYHPELQPIETCWAVVKNYMADNCDLTIDNFRYHLPIDFTMVTGKTCKKIISKVRKQEDKFWEEDEKLDEIDNSALISVVKLKY
jgi:transposase